MGGRGMEGGGRGRLYTYRYTVTTRMLPALTGAAMRAILNVSLTLRDKVTKQCPQTTTFERKSRNGFEPAPSAYQPNALPPV